MERSAARDFTREGIRLKYVLLQMPDGEIKIIDNSSYIGKKRVEALCIEGATPAGTIESDLNRLRLETGLMHRRAVERDEALDKLYKIKEFVQEV